MYGRALDWFQNHSGALEIANKNICQQGQCLYLDRCYFEEKLGINTKYREKHDTAWEYSWQKVQERASLQMHE